MDVIKRLTLFFFVPLQGAMGENLSIGNAEGSLTGPASFEDIKFKNDQGLDLEVRSVAYDWQPRRLLSREVNVGPHRYRWYHSSFAGDSG